MQAFSLPNTTNIANALAGTGDTSSNGTMIYGNGYLVTCVMSASSDFRYWVDNGENGGSLTKIITASNFKSYNVVYGNGNFIVYGNTGYYKSTDGTPLTLTTLTSKTWASVDVVTGAMFFKDRFVSLDLGSGTANMKLQYSTDGITWTKTNTGILVSSNYSLPLKHAATMNKDGRYDHEI